MRPHGWLGLGIILVAEVLLFSGNAVIGRWFTPIVWTGYLLLVDAWLFRLTEGLHVGLGLVLMSLSQFSFRDLAQKLSKEEQTAAAG